jgi:protein O-mannosyl-transferase
MDAQRAGHVRTAIGLMLASCACALYLGSISTPFIFDDNTAIVSNPQVRRLWPLSEAMTAPPDLPTSNRPLAALSFSINYALGELRVEGYHAVNLALHGANALLLYALLLLLLRHPQLPEQTRRAALPLSAAATLLWCVHPLLSESVVYVTQRTELMAAFFYLATLVCAVRAFCEPQRRVWEFAACVAALLGIGAKETAATVGLAVLCLDRLAYSPSVLVALRSRRVLYAGLASQLALALAMAIAAPYSRAGVGYHDGVSALQWLATQAGVLVMYLQLALWPRSLSISYDYPIAQNLLRDWPQLLLMAALGLGTLWLVARKGLAAFGAALFFIHLAPSSSFIPISTEVAVERRMYLPTAVLVVYGVVLAHRLLVKLKLRVRARHALAAIAMLALTCALCARTLARVQDYESPLRIWQAALAADPHNPQALLGVAGVLRELARCSDARAFAQPLTRRPREYAGARDWAGRAHVLLGQCDEDEGKLSAALAHDDAVADDSPELLVALMNGARVLMRLGDIERAVQRLQRTVALPEAGAHEYHDLGVALSRLGRHDAAAKSFAHAYELDPSKPDSLEALALSLGAQGKWAEAAALLSEVVRRWPNDLGAYAKLGRVLVELGRDEQALAALDHALAAGSPQPETHLARCRAMARTGRFDQALFACDQALRLAPKNERFRAERARVAALASASASASP